MSKLTDALVIKHKDALGLIERLNKGEELSTMEKGGLDKHIDQGCAECAAKLAEVYIKKEID